MRRFAWQIGGLATALGAVLALGVLAFACGSSPTVRVTPTAKTTPRPTPTPDPRVAVVEAAARRYVQALDDAMKTGSPQELDSLSVPGSQAEGNAGITAHIVRDTGKTFIVTATSVTAVNVQLGSSTATVTMDYSVTGYDASWPNLQSLGSSRIVQRHLALELDQLHDKWLVATAN